MKPELIGQLSETEIQELKKTHTGGIYAVKVDGHISYFKNPNRAEMNCSMSKADSFAPLHMFEELANVTFIGGSREPLDNDEMFYGLTNQLKTKMDGKKAEMVNL